MVILLKLLSCLTLQCVLFVFLMLLVRTDEHVKTQQEEFEDIKNEL